MSRPAVSSAVDIAIHAAEMDFHAERSDGRTVTDQPGTVSGPFHTLKHRR